MTYSFKMHLILEGDDDRKLFRALLRRVESINVVYVWGADNVTGVIQKIDEIRQKSTFVATLGIIDRDYRIALGTLYRSPNLLYSDRRDIECMMFESPSFDAVLAEFGSDRKIAAFGGVSAVRETTLKAASFVGTLRFYSLQAKLPVSFKKLDLERLICRRSLALRSNELIPHLNARQGVDGHILDLDAHVEAKRARDAALCDQDRPYFSHPLLVCRGHDLMEILAIGFRSLLGNRSSAESSRENIESLFRLSFAAHFSQTDLASSMMNWADREGLPGLITM